MRGMNPRRVAERDNPGHRLSHARDDRRGDRGRRWRRPCHAEIIVSDDSSGDGTLEAAQVAVAGYTGPHRISVRSTPRNLGLCAHLTELATLATGEMLVFLAGDDIAYPQRVRRLLEAFAAHPQAQVVGSLVDDIDGGGKVIDAAMCAACRPNRPALAAASRQAGAPCSARRWRSGARC